jgi:hypothetical protein
VSVMRCLASIDHSRVAPYGARERAAGGPEARVQAAHTAIRSGSGLAAPQRPSPAEAAHRRASDPPSTPRRRARRAGASPSRRSASPRSRRVVRSQPKRIEKTALPPALRRRWALPTGHARHGVRGLSAGPAAPARPRGLIEFRLPPIHQVRRRAAPARRPRQPRPARIGRRRRSARIRQPGPQPASREDFSRKLRTPV